MNITMRVTDNMVFVYQLFINCVIQNLKDDDIILIMNSAIKSHDIDYKLIDKKTIKELRRTIKKKYLQEYTKLKVEKSCYNNPKMLGLLWMSEQNRSIDQYNFKTDEIVKQEYNKHHTKK